MKIIIKLLIITLVLISCKSQNKEDKLVQFKNSVENLIIYGIENKSFNVYDSISPIINELLINDSSYFNHIVYNEIDSINNELLYKINSIEYNPEVFIEFDLPCFNVFMDKNFSDTLKNQNYQDYIKGFFERYYRVIDSGEIGIITEKDSIDYFGVVDIPQCCLYLGTKIKPQNTLSKKEWRRWFQSLNSVIEFYTEIYDEISIKKFGKRFEEVSYEKKTAIIKFRPLKIMINFDAEYFYQQDMPEPE
jgi:hypothetical protein